MIGRQLLKTLGRKNMFSQPLYRFCQMSAYPHQHMFIEIEEAAKFQKDQKVKFLDVRDIEDYKINHISGNTYSADMFFWYRTMTDEHEVEKMKNEFQKYLTEMGINKDDYLICYEDKLNSRFGASCRAYYLLKLFGHKYVSILNGGMHGWVQHGYKTCNLPKTADNGNFVIDWNHDEWLHKDDVHEFVNDEKHLLIDVRDEEEWFGHSSSPLGKDFVPRKGRIEGAIWMPWYNFAHEQNGLTYVNTEQQVIEHMEDHGIKDKDANITLYCFKGARASLAFCALRNAGYTNVKNYLGSWNEWASDQSKPIDEGVLKA